MKIIGHRGAAGLALENTVQSIHSAIKAGVDAVEIDIRLTKDKHLVLSHDVSTGRVSPTDKHIHHSQLEELQAISLHDGSQLSTLEEAFRAVGKTPLVIDAKGSGWAEPLVTFLSKKPTRNITVIALNHKELSVFAKLRPDVSVYALDFWSPFDVMQTAHQKKFTGIDISFWFLNPLTYWLARWWGLKIIVFTVDHVWLARLLGFLYPGTSITTNRPDKLQALRNT